MRWLLALCALVLLAGAIATWGVPGGAAAARGAASGPPASVHCAFSPRGGGLPAVIQAITQAQHEVLVLGSLSGADRIAAALAQARQRGLAVGVIAPIGPGGTAGEELLTLSQAGVAIGLDSQHARIDGALLVIDGTTVVTAGSLADRAETNDAQVVLVVEEAAAARTAADAWRTHRAHADPLPAAGAAPLGAAAAP